jgi:ankyrin repeat protein
MGRRFEIFNAEQSSWDDDNDDQDHLPSLGLRPIHIAARYGTNEVFRLLLQKVGTSELEALDVNGARPVHHAAANSDNPEILTTILTESLNSSYCGGGVFTEDARNNLPVHYAAKFAVGDETVRVLTRGVGRDPRWWKQVSTANVDGMCAIHCVAERQGGYAHGSVAVATAILSLAETAQVLLQQPEGGEGGDGLLAVHIAAQHNAPVLKLVIATGGPKQVRLSDCNGNLPIHYAGLNEDIEALKLILNVAGPTQLLEANRFGNRTIHYAAQHNTNNDVLDLILQMGGLEQLAARNIHGMEPLHCAATRQGSVAAITLMLNGDAEVNSRDDDGVAPLDIAVREGHADGVEAMLQFGADSSSAADGGDALTAALRRLDEQIRGVNQPRDRQLLFESPKVPTDPIVTALIEHGADTKNVPDDLDATVKLSVQCAASRTTVQSVLQRRQLRSCSGFLTPLQAARLRLALGKCTHSRLACDSIVTLCLYEDELVRLIAGKVVAKRKSHIFREDAARMLDVQQRELGLRGEPMLPGTRVCVDGEVGVVEEQTQGDDLSDQGQRGFEGQRVRFCMQDVKIVSLDVGARHPQTWDVLPAVVFDVSEAQALAVSSHELSQKYEYYYLNGD